MGRAKLLIIISVCIAIVICAGQEQAAANEQYTSRLETSVDKFLNPLVEKDIISGSILIAKGDKVLLSKGFGSADREHKSPNTASTPFRIASVSKAITAVAVLQLVEKGMLQLDTKLESLVSGFANGDQITVEHLLTHKSGIPSDVYLEGFREKSMLGITLDEAVIWVRDTPSRFEPGSRFEYSNSGYLLLTSIIEKVSGLSFEQYLARNIFGPAGMNSSGLNSAAMLLPGRARGYSRSELGDIVNTTYRDPSFGWGYGAIYSTVLDLFKFNRALMEDRLLSKDTRRLMWSSQSDTPWKNHYGMGWFLDDLEGDEVIMALGSTGGYAATLRYFSAKDILVVVLMNQFFVLDKELYDQLSLIALGKTGKPIFEGVTSNVRKQFATFIGEYEMDDGVLLTLKSNGNQLLFGDHKTGIFFEVHVITDRKGFVAEQNALLRFQETSSGEIDLVALYGNLVWRGRRIHETQQ